MLPPASDQPSILSNNVATFATPPDEVPDESADEGFADVALGAGVLALLATGLTIVGHQFGGPLPGLGFWRAFAPLLLFPLAILLGVVLAPESRIVRKGPLRRRVGLVAAGLGIFASVLVVLNGPSLVLLPLK